MLHDCLDHLHSNSVPHNNVLGSAKRKAFWGQQIRHSSNNNGFSDFCPLTLYHIIPTFNETEESSILKTLWEKEKMLVTSIFSNSHNLF